MPCKLTFNLLTLKVVSESCVTWATSVPILVFLGVSVLELFQMYATDRQTDIRQTDVRPADNYIYKVGLQRMTYLNMALCLRF